MFHHAWHISVAGTCSGVRYFWGDCINQAQAFKRHQQQPIEDAPKIVPADESITKLQTPPKLESGNLGTCNLECNTETPGSSLSNRKCMECDTWKSDQYKELGLLEKNGDKEITNLNGSQRGRDVEVISQWRKPKDLFLEKFGFEGFDYDRALSFAFFGAVYASGPGYCVYNVLYPRWTWFAKLPPLAKAVTDTSFNNPFIFFPLMYICRGFVLNGEMNVSLAFQQWKENFWRDYAAAFSVWVPFMWISFRYVPLTYLWPYMSTVGMVWAVVLSKMEGG